MMKRARGSISIHPIHIPSPSVSPEPSRKGLPGNNRFGARGTLKCQHCRDRKARCEFKSKEDDCSWCAHRGLTCGVKLLGEKHQIREQRRRLGLGNSKLSVIAEKLERGWPRATPWEIFEMLREELIAAEGPYDGESSMTPQLRAESVKIEDSPRTPPISRASMRFMEASQKTPPPTQQTEPRATSAQLEQLPQYVLEPQYVATTQYVTTRNYDEREQLLDPNMFTPRAMETWPFPNFAWQG